MNLICSVKLKVTALHFRLHACCQISPLADYTKPADAEIVLHLSPSDSPYCDSLNNIHYGHPQFSNCHMLKLSPRGDDRAVCTEHAVNPQ